MSTTELTLHDLDEFASKIKNHHNRSVSSIKNNWFQERIVDKKGAHCKGFASETLAIADVLGLFVEVVLKPMSVLDEEILCFGYFRELLDCLRRGRSEDAAIALQAAQMHHKATKSMRPEVLKPKHHYTMHGVLSWMDFGVLITCFGAESEHEQPKRLMNHCYNKCTLTALR